jgi:hypothetical protein
VAGAAAAATRTADGAAAESQPGAAGAARADRLRVADSSRLKSLALQCAASAGISVCLAGGFRMATEFARKDYEHSEGRVAKTIENQTARVPSDAFLWMAVGAMAISATTQMMGNKHVSLFVGQWAPTFLIFGLYNKLVKQLGSDRTENAV